MIKDEVLITQATSSALETWVSVGTLLFIAITAAVAVITAVKYFFVKPTIEIFPSEKIGLTFPFPGPINVSVNCGNMSYRNSFIEQIRCLLTKPDGKRIEYRWGQFFEYVTDRGEYRKLSDPHTIFLTPNSSSVYNIQFEPCLDKDENGYWMDDAGRFSWINGTYQLEFYVWGNEETSSKRMAQVEFDITKDETDSFIIMSEPEGYGGIQKPVKANVHFVYIRKWRKKKIVNN